MTEEQFKLLYDELREINKKLSYVSTGQFQTQCDHDYPTVWHGTVPPCCSRCGIAIGFSTTFSSKKNDHDSA